jgi:hypothetical protein
MRDRILRGVGKAWFCPPRDTGDDSILDTEKPPLLQEKDTGRGERHRDAGSSKWVFSVGSPSIAHEAKKLPSVDTT